MFDPYHHMLGLPERPVTFYHLLGLTPGERNHHAIEEAALGCTSKVRPYQIAYPQESARLLNEIAQALAILCDPPAREAYDAALKNGQPKPLPALKDSSPSRAGGMLSALVAALQVAQQLVAAEGGCTVWQVRMRQVALTADQRKALRTQFRKGGGCRARILRRKTVGTAKGELILAVVDGSS